MWVEGGGRTGLRGSFFFQAEEGIRDRLVTGVQTCALPISNHRKQRRVEVEQVGPKPPRGAGCRLHVAEVLRQPNKFETENRQRSL